MILIIKESKRKTNVTVSVVGVAAVLLLVTAPTMANHIVFGVNNIPFKGYPPNGYWYHGAYSQHRYYSHGHWYDELFLNETG